MWARSFKLFVNNKIGVLCEFNKLLIYRSFFCYNINVVRHNVFEKNRPDS